jgi:Immunity protein 8
LKLKLVIRSISVWGHPDIRTWQPDDPGKIAEIVFLDIGERTKVSADTFSIRVATPAGLSTLQARKGILAIRPLLVMQRYDLADLRRWLRYTVAKCEGENWTACVNNLRLYFDWEYDGYKEV